MKVEAVRGYDDDDFYGVLAKIPFHELEIRGPEVVAVAIKGAVRGLADQYIAANQEHILEGIRAALTPESLTAIIREVLTARIAQVLKP